MSEKPRIMTLKEKAEIEEIERAAKERFEQAGRRLLGSGFTARHPRHG